MLADQVDYVVGVDTHRDEHVLAVVPLHERWQGRNVGLFVKGATVGTPSCFLY